jgi:hypothetical protein
MAIALRGGTGRVVSVVLVLAAATVAMTRAKEKKTPGRGGRARLGARDREQATHRHPRTQRSTHTHNNENAKSDAHTTHAPFAMPFAIRIRHSPYGRCFGWTAFAIEVISVYISHEHPNARTKRISAVPRHLSTFKWRGPKQCCLSHRHRRMADGG